MNSSSDVFINIVYTGRIQAFKNAIYICVCKLASSVML